VVVSVILAWLSLLSARALLRGARAELSMAQVTGGSIFLFSCALMLTRAIMAWVWPDSAAGVLEARPLQVIVFVTGALVPVLASYCFLLLCTDRMREEVERGAAIDFLTGILNRGGIEQAGGRIFARSRRHGSRCAAIVIDVDYFKRINDANGHAVGDQALQVCVERLLGQLREEDTLGRLGGEEFLLLLEDTTEEQALKMAERLRSALADRPLALETGPHRSTISLGVALLGPNDFSFSDLLRRADRALYAAKDAGRNRVQLAGLPVAEASGLTPPSGLATSLPQ
jgi:diguanylate cyclase (GGDEF)-like protein